MNSADSMTLFKVGDLIRTGWIEFAQIFNLQQNRQYYVPNWTVLNQTHIMSRIEQS